MCWILKRYYGRVLQYYGVIMLDTTSLKDNSYIWNEEKRRDRVAKKLLDYYKKKQRKKKIEKLQSNNDHWTGLS